MRSAHQQYTEELRQKFGYHATWNPGLPLQLGDIGIFRDNIFTRLSNLRDQGIAFEVRKDPTKTPLEHQTEGSISVTTKLSGTAAPAGSVLTRADAGIIVEFSREHATLFKAVNTTSPSIKDAIGVGEQVLKQYRAGKWNKKWVVITELVKAESATIIISNSTDGKIELKANVRIDKPGLDISDAGIQWSTRFSRGLETRIISAEGLTPLFRIMGMKSRIFMPPVFAATQVDPFDLVTPETARKRYRPDLYFGHIDAGGMV
jgi:hypothetical protein